MHPCFNRLNHPAAPISRKTREQQYLLQWKLQQKFTWQHDPSQLFCLDIHILIDEAYFEPAYSSRQDLEMAYT